MQLNFQMQKWFKLYIIHFCDIKNIFLQTIHQKIIQLTRHWKMQLQPQIGNFEIHIKDGYLLQVNA